MIAYPSIQCPGLTHPGPQLAFFAKRAGDANPEEEPADSVDALLEETLRLPPGERAAHLDRVCRHKPALRKTLDELLAGVEQPAPPGFLQPIPISSTILKRLRRILGNRPNE